MILSLPFSPNFLAGILSACSPNNSSNLQLEVKALISLHIKLSCSGLTPLFTNARQLRTSQREIKLLVVSAHSHRSKQVYISNIHIQQQQTTFNKSAYNNAEQLLHSSVSHSDQKICVDYLQRDSMLVKDAFRF